MRPAVLVLVTRDARLSIRLLLLSCIAVMLVAYLLTSAFPDFRERMLSAGRHAPAFLRRLMQARAGELRFESFAALAYVHPVMLALLSIWPITRAAQAVAGEIERGTLGWRLSYPLGRIPFLLVRAALMMVGVAVLQLALFLGFRASLAWFAQANAGAWPYALVAFNGFWVYAAAGALTLWASAASSRASVPHGVGTVLVLGSMLLENVGGMVALFENFRWLSLYHYFDYQAILTTGVVAWRDCAILAGVTVVGLAGALWSFSRRDLQI